MDTFRPTRIAPMPLDSRSGLSIGAFARLSGLTVKALRHYDAVDVLRPTAVDPRTGYRRYGPGQLAAARRVRALADAGLPLRHVRAVLAGTADADSVEAVGADPATQALRAARRGLRAELASVRARLAWVDAELAALADAPSGFGAAVAVQAPLTVASVRDVLAGYADAGALFDELSHALSPGLAPAAMGAPAGVRGGAVRGAVWHACVGDGDRIDCEALVTLGDARRGGPAGAAGGRVGGRVQVGELAGGPVASLIHVGDDISLEAAWPALRRWAAAHGHVVAGPGRELYWGGTGAAGVTEIQLPLKEPFHERPVLPAGRRLGRRARAVRALGIAVAGLLAGAVGRHAAAQPAPGAPTQPR